MPGAHNALNAAAALTASARSAATSPPPRRRCATSRAPGGASSASAPPRQGALVVDDYAHHPTEVLATLEAARTLNPRGWSAVFQPHLYSRTQHQAREFGAALALADLPVVTEIYPARERAEDYPGVSGPAGRRGGRRRGRRQARGVAAGLRLRGALPARRAARGRPAADARRGRYRRAGQEAGRSGSNPRRVKKILAGVVVAACALGRRLVLAPRLLRSCQVRDVFVTGLSSSEAPRSAPRSKAAALDMTTLHVREDRCARRWRSTPRSRASTPTPTSPTS